MRRVTHWLQQRQLSLCDFLHGYEISISAVQLAINAMSQDSYHQTVKPRMVNVGYILREKDKQSVE